MNRRTLMTAAAALLLAGGVSRAGDGVAPDAIAWAQVAAFDGPAAALGTAMNAGLRAAFEEVNRAGGIHGRKLTLATRDDGYEPDRSIEAVRTLVSEGAVFGLIGAVGTPTAKVIQPIAAKAGMPFVGPFTGAGFLRDAALGNVLNVRASYGAETEAWMRLLVDERKLERIAILYQDDAFGRAGLEGVEAALGRRGMALAASGTYARNTLAVKAALIEIRKADPQAVVIVGAYKPAAEFIRNARKLKLDATFVNISFVGSDALARELGPDGAGVIVSQVVPFPWDRSLPVVAAYQDALAASDPGAEPGFVSLEGYLAGRIAAETLRRTGPLPTQAGFMAAAAALGEVDLGGLVARYGAGDNQGLDDVFLTVIGPDGRYAPLGGPQS